MSSARNSFMTRSGSFLYFHILNLVITFLYIIILNTVFIVTSLIQR